MAWAPDSRRLASGAWGTTVVLWDFQRDKNNSACAAIKAIFGAWLSLPTAVRVWDGWTGQELLCLRGHEDVAYGVAFSPDGRRIVSGAEHGDLRIWEADTGLCRQVIRGDGDGEATAAGTSVFPWLAPVSTLETVIASARTGRKVAWLPAWLQQIKTHTEIKTHSEGRTWAGPSGDHLYVFALEGNASPTS